MNQFFNLPIEFRMAWLFVLGTCIGSFLNVCIYRLPKFESVVRGGSHCMQCGAAVRWFDNIPIISWLRLWGKCRACKAPFSIRYLLIELLTGTIFAALYWWEVERIGLWPAPLAPPDSQLHAQYAAHVLLIAFMLVASLIDIDLQIIPDEVTVPGTLAGLLLAAAYPWSLLPGWSLPFAAAVPIREEFLPLTNTMANWPAWLDGAPQGRSLALALACFLGWCIALWDWRWRSRRGTKMAVRLLVHGILRYWLIHGIAVVGAVLIVAAWWWLPVLHWRGLLTALVGMAFGGGLLWIVRIISGAALGREAMGFGDVTLVAMFGSFLGWQAVLIMFFVAPLYGLVIGIAQWVTRGENQIPYGPFLCLGAITVLVRWAYFWAWLLPLFDVLGWFLPLLIFGSMFLMAPLLLIMRLIKYQFSDSYR